MTLTGFTVENHYWRAFEHEHLHRWRRVRYHIGFIRDRAGERAGQGQANPLTVNLYTNSGAPFPGGTAERSLPRLDRINIPDQSRQPYSSGQSRRQFRLGHWS